MKNRWKEGTKHNHCILFISVLMAIGLFLFRMPVHAEEASFQTKNTIIDIADNYVIIQDVTGKYGLLDDEGKESISCDYDEMSFAEDTEEYSYVVVKQGSTWGILDYQGNELVEVRYKSVCAYQNGNTTASGYDGNKTYFYNLKGKNLGYLQGEYTVLTDFIFQGNDDLKNKYDKKILDYSDAGLLDPSDDSEDRTALCVKVGSQVAAECYSSGEGKDLPTFGRLRTTCYVNIYDQDGELSMSIKPDESWTEDVDQDEYETGGVKLVKAVSDTSLLVKQTGFADKYLIYDTEKQSFSDEFQSIGEFRDGKAFAFKKSKKLCVIDTIGNIISDESIKIDDYERKGHDSVDNAYYLYADEDEENYKLYSLTQLKFLDADYKDVIFPGNGYVIVEDEESKCSVLNEQAETVIEAGLYGKEILEKAYYASNCISITETVGEKTTVTFHSQGATDEEKVQSLLSRPEVILSVVITVFLFLLLFGSLLWRDHKRKKEEIRAEKEWKERIRRENEARNYLDYRH